MNLIQIKQIEGLEAYIQQNVPAVLDGYQVVFQTGDQFVSGNKTFFSTIYASGGAFLSGNLLVTGNSTFGQNVYVSGELWITGSDGSPVQITGAGGGGGGGAGSSTVDQPYLLYVTGEQQVSGAKVFQQSITGNQEALISGNTYISGQLWVTGSNGEPWQITDDGSSTVNQKHLVYTTGDQFITGGKQFLEPITGHKGFRITGDHGTYMSKILDTQLRIYSDETNPNSDNSLGLIVGKNESGPQSPSLSVYNYRGNETDVGRNLGHASMFYANSQHFNITNAKETGDIRFVTVGNAVRDGAIRSFNWWDPESTRMIIHSGGNIGIGVTGLDPNNSDISIEPLERLHVSGGNFRVDGNIYNSGQLWITGSLGQLIQIDGSVQDGGSVDFDYITAIGITGQHLSGHRLDVGAAGATISGDTIISGDLTVVGEVALTGGATVGEEDGDSIFIIGVGDANEPRVGVGRYTNINQVESLFHVSGNPEVINFTLQGHQFTSGDQYVSGELWITGSNGSPIQITNNSTANVNGRLNSIQYNSGSELGGLPVLYYGDYGKNDADSQGTSTNYNSGALVFAAAAIEAPANCKAIISSGTDTSEADKNFGLIFRRIDHPTDDAEINQSIILGSYPENGGWSDGGGQLNDESYSVLAADIEHQGVIINGPPGYIANDKPNNLDRFDLVVYDARYDQPGSDANISKKEMGIIKAGSIFVTGVNDPTQKVTQLKPFGLNSTDITTSYTLDKTRNNEIIHFDPSTNIEITLPTTNDFIDFKFTARHVSNNGNYVGFKSDDASTVHGVSTGFNAEHDWATIYRGNGDWYIYGNNLIADPGTPTTTTAAPTTTTVGPTTTTVAPTTTTATPTTTTTATPTTTTAAPTNTKLLTQGLMMRFFGWDDPFTETTSSFGNDQTVDVNGSQVTRDVIYPSYKSPSLPQLTGAFTTNTYGSTWSDVVRDITDVHGVRHTGVMITGGQYMSFPQFQDNSAGGQWDSFNGNMNFLTGVDSDQPSNWTFTWWQHNKWTETNYPGVGGDSYKIWSFGQMTDHRNMGPFIKADTPQVRLQMRGDPSNGIVAIGQKGRGATDGSNGRIDGSKGDDYLRQITGEWWTFHSLSYNGGSLGVGTSSSEIANNVMWAVGTGVPSQARGADFAGHDIGVALYSGNQETFASDGYQNTLETVGSLYAQLGDSKTNPLFEIDNADTFTIGYANAETVLPWTGYISDFRLYSRALSTGEINAIFTGKGLV